MNQAVGTIVLCSAAAAVGVAPVGLLYRRFAKFLADKTPGEAVSSQKSPAEREQEAEALMKAHP